MLTIRKRGFENWEVVDDQTGGVLASGLKTDDEAKAEIVKRTTVKNTSNTTGLGFGGKKK